jgi:Na+/H+ antiporter NhaC
MTGGLQQMQQENQLKFRGGIMCSLIPVIIYVFFCMVLFIGFKAFNMEALAVGGFIALLIGGIFCTSYAAFWESAIRGISSITSVSVVVILLLVGMFSQLIKTCGLSGGFVWMANALGIHGGFFVAFTFLATCIVSTATGSSIGTMFIAFPIFYPAGLMLGANEMFMAGSIVSGAIFGDNLAPISDTTIASASTQQFRDGRPADIGGVVSSRLRYSAVAGIISIVIFAVLGGIGGTFQGGEIEAAANPVSLVMLIPVVIMLVVSTKTRNIYEGILVGLGLGTIVGLAAGLFTFDAVFANDAGNNAAVGFLIDGVNNILPTCALVISVFGIMGVLNDAGMLNLIAEKILQSKMAQTETGAELLCMAGISLTTVLLGGVTSASILTFGPILNKIGSAKNIHPYRRANLLDGTANSLPAIIPFLSVFVFIGSALTGLSPVVVAGGTVYGFVLFFVFLVAVITGWGRRAEV